MSNPFRNSCATFFLAIAILGAGSVARRATAKTHSLREGGRTLIEAENYSALSTEPKNNPKTEVSDWCSGKKNLGYIWGGTWFEVEVDVPRMLNYTLSFRVASEEGTRMEVQMFDAAGKMNSLATVNVPSTGSWRDYTNTRDLTLSLAAGVQTLRFKCLRKGMNVDYLTFTAGSGDEIAVAHPVANSGPDINPLKGFNSRWWREGEDFASVGFQFLDWRKLEPEDDFFDWAYTEDVLSRAGTQGRHAILQLVVDWDDASMKEPVGDSHYKGPDWLLDRVGQYEGPVYPDDPNSRTSRATRYDHPEFIVEATEAIKALLERYRDDPRIFVIQVGVLGYWGEWHTFPRTDWSPAMSTKVSILDAYMSNLGADGLTQVRYADQPGLAARPRMGYSNSSATLTNRGMEFGKAIAEGRLWRNGPVGGEWPTNVDDQLWRAFFQTEKGYSFIEQGRYSTMSPPEPKQIAEKIPGWNQEGLFMKMHRRMGYNFQATAVRHLVSVNSRQTQIEVDLQNVGIAPFYKDWDVQLAILDADSGRVFCEVDIDTDLRKLGPTESTTLAGTISKKLDPRVDYRIGLRILQSGADEEKVAKWKLDPRNAYVVLANDIDIIKGVWDERKNSPKRNALIGGWNVLDVLQRQQPDQAESLEGPFFPFEGSFRPVDG